MDETKGLIRESKFTSTARQAGTGWDWVHISFVFFPVKGGGCNKKASPMYVCVDVFMGQAEEEETHGRRWCSEDALVS